MEVNKDLQDTYDEYYDESITKWRELGARQKARNIIEISEGYSFKKVKSLIDYGHINVYTPSLLRFLLKTENFQIVNDKMAFYPKEIIAFSWKGKQKKLSFYKKIKLEVYILLRSIAYFLFPKRRKEVMINTYTVLSK